MRRRGWLQVAARVAARLAALGVALPGSARASGAAGAATVSEADDTTVRRGRPLVFPRDHGAHLAARIEWWYLTGWLGDGDGDGEQPRFGLQLTFFRSRTGLAGTSPSRFAPRHLLFAHAALTDLAAGTHRHAQRIARWSGAADAPLARASVADTDVQVGNWSLVRRPGDGGYAAQVEAADFDFAIETRRTQPLLLQGDAGFSRKGPQERQASHYVSEPQLAAQGRLTVAGRTQPLAGRAWLDHEWSDEILHPEAVGWDWLGINLLDGGALTAFRLRRADSSALWAGGSMRAAGGEVRAFAETEMVFTPGRSWQSPATGARYPVQWQLQTPAGSFTLRALLDAQELDSRASTGTVYWEGLSELLDAGGRRIGIGYLEMTGYVGRLRLN